MRPDSATPRPIATPRRAVPFARPHRVVSALPALLAAIWLVSAAGCTTAGPREPDRTALAWEAARETMQGGSFASAETAFLELVASHPERPEGREALYLLGVLHLDPRNPAWDAGRAEEYLRTYLHLPGPQQNRAEALALFALARRLVEASTGDAAPPVEGVAIEGGNAAAENGRLAKEIAEKDREIARLQEELERIRRALSPP